MTGDYWIGIVLLAVLALLMPMIMHRVDGIIAARKARKSP